MEKRSGRGVMAMLAAVMVMACACRLGFPEMEADCLLNRWLVLPAGVFTFWAAGRWFLGREGELSRKALPLCTAALLAFQLLYGWNAYFLTGWDGFVVLGNADFMANGAYDLMWHGYYQIYPNNVLLTWSYAQLLKLSRALGGGGPYILIAFQCAVSAWGAWLVFHLALDETGSSRAAWWTWGAYALFLGCSPWVMIPYSDATALALPLALLRLLQMKWEGRKDLGRWALVGLTAYLCWQLKPQAAVMAAAVSLVGLGRGGLGASLRRSAALAAGFALAAAVMAGAILPDSHIQVDRDKALGPLHYLMMGLSEDPLGYSEADVAFSASFDDPAERARAQWAQAGERAKALGPAGLLRHTGQKLALNYGDGSFAWGSEGDFYHQVLPERGRVLSPLFRNLFYQDGAAYPWLLTVQQVVWAGLLAGCALLALGKDDRSDILRAAAWGVLGLTVFELLFEARARYLYCSAGVYVLLGCLGWREVFFEKCRGALHFSRENRYNNRNDPDKKEEVRP